MPRFITIETYAGDVTAYTEQEDWKAVLAEVDTKPADAVACWVWQYADSKEQAVEQHMEKHDLWDADSQAGREIKNTY